jgi:YebC/PmpR family DNA-binding regulatory protein
MGRIGNIKERKSKQDAKRANIYTKLARLITVAAKEGGIDPEYNASLKSAIEKAKAQNMPNDNIDRAIKKGSGELGGSQYEKIIYEGYGPGGVAVVVEALTDNRNRTAGEVRNTFDKNGGNLGSSGCVSFLFDRKGQIIIEKTNSVDEEILMNTVLETGAEDFVVDEEAYEILTLPETYISVKEALQKEGYELLNADIVYIPNTTTSLQEADIKKMNKMIDSFEENDDVQEVHHNWDAVE